MTTTLTVGIPTFNGAPFIAEAINSVVECLSPDQLTRVDILVSDNASSDGTAQIVEEYVLRYPTLVTLRRNESNIGFDANVDAIFRSARGDYVHILGDDDFVMQGALSSVFRVLDRHPDVGVIVGQVTFLDIASGVRSPGKTYERDATCDGDSFFQLTEWGTAAVSSLIIRRSDWLTQPLSRYVGGHWIHVAAIVNILATGVPGYVLADDLVTVRVNNPRWGTSNGNQLYIGMRHLELISEMNSLGYSPSTFAWYVAEVPTARNIFSTRSSRTRDNLQTAVLMKRFYGNRWRFWLFSLPALLLPATPIRLLAAARRTLKVTASSIGRSRSTISNTPTIDAEDDS